MKRAAVWCACFSLAALAVILYLSFHRDTLAQEPGALEAAGEEGAEQTDPQGDGQKGPPGQAGSSGDQKALAGSSQPETFREPDKEGQPGDASQAGGPAQAENSAGQGAAGEDETQELKFSLEEGSQRLAFSEDASDTSYLRIPLPEGVKASDITIENYYMDQELWILLDGGESGFYDENAISGNLEMVSDGIYEKQDKALRLRFKLTGIFEYRSILESQELYISFLSPREVYDRIVVIDPACGGTNTGQTQGELVEKEINLAIALKLKEKLDKTDIKAYYTRVDDVNPAQENRILLANETRADLYIRIELGADEDSGVYGTGAVYNEDFFIPGFGSPELARILEEEVVNGVKGKELGLKSAEESDTAIWQALVPAVALRAGYATNRQEAILLTREDYQEKIAEGIYSAILKAYGEMGN